MEGKPTTNSTFKALTVVYDLIRK